MKPEFVKRKVALNNETIAIMRRLVVKHRKNKENTAISLEIIALCEADIKWLKENERREVIKDGREGSSSKTIKGISFPARDRFHGKRNNSKLST